MLRKQVARKARPDHYPAPYALLRHWANNGGNTSALYAGEIREVSRLITSDNAQQLIRVFLLQERLKSLGNRHSFHPARVHVVGGGVMGGDIAAWCALQGMQVTLQDRAPDLLGKTIARAHSLFKRRLKKPRLVQQALDRLIPDCAGNGIPRADVLIEAIYEDAGAKRRLFRELEPRLRRDALLASNTSSIPLDELAQDLQEPERLVGLHFFNPVARMPLLEVVHEDNTDPEALQRALSFARHIDKLPLPVHSSPGFLVNRVLMPYLLQAMQLLETGQAPEVLDRAAVDFGMPLGPIELADRVGLDICLSVARKLIPVFGGAIPERLDELVDAGHLGRKSGQGFYAWREDHPVRARTDSEPATLQELADRMLGRLGDEAAACLREGVVADADLVDAGVIFGTGYAPFRGGPLHYRSQQQAKPTSLNPGTDRPPRGGLFKEPQGGNHGKRAKHHLHAGRGNAA